MTSSNPQPKETELVIRQARRSLWLLLAVLIVLALWLVLQSFSPGTPFTEGFTRVFPVAFPIGVVLATFWVRSAAGGKQFSTKNPNVRAVLEDEQRRAALGKAFRVAFFVLLGAQPLLAWLLWNRPNALILMGALTGTIGVISLAAALLALDRD